jgi:NAD kinase
MVTLDILASSSPMTLEIDGSDRGEVGPGHRLSIGPSAVTARLIRVSGARFAARARSKLQLRDSPELGG